MAAKYFGVRSVVQVWLVLILAVLSGSFTSTAFAVGGRGSGGRSGGHSSGSHYSTSSRPKGSSGSHWTSGHSTKTSVAGVRRDTHGRIARSGAAKHDFMKQTGYPDGRPGYVVDHRIPLKRGGADTPSNMQWQTRAAAKAKDKIE